MSKQLNDPSNADETEPTDSSTELTEREIAIAEGRDPDAEPSLIEAEAAEEVVEDTPEQPEGEVADDNVSDPPADTPVGPWYSDTDREYASRHGISEWHLQQFGSREEFSRAAALLEAAASARQADKKAAPGPLLEPAPEKEPEYVDEPVVDGKVNVEWYRQHDYDEGTIKAMEAQRAWQDKLEKQFAEQETRAQQQQREAEEAAAQREINAFHEAADLARPDFYGKTTDEYGNYLPLTPEQNKRRETLFEEIYWLSQRIAHEQQRSTGKVAIPSWSALIKQAEVRAFGEELNRKTQEERLAAAKSQNRAIRPAAGSVGAGTARRASTMPATESVADISQDPEVIEAWNRASKNNR